MNNNPFLPVSFPPGPPTKKAWEDGPEKYAPIYNGQNQTFHINTRYPQPPMESGPGPADPTLSDPDTGIYTGDGYGEVGQGTIGVGKIVLMTFK